MFPANRQNYELQELPSDFPDALKRSMEDTVRAYNSRIYGATATSGRRTLEGIFKNLAENNTSKKNLAKIVEEVGKTYDFAKPIRNLSDAIRRGGNLGAHFDEGKECDAEMARKIVELLDYLISYLYVLPTRIQNLEESIEQEE